VAVRQGAGLTSLRGNTTIEGNNRTGGVHVYGFTHWVNYNTSANESVVASNNTLYTQVRATHMRAGNGDATVDANRKCLSRYVAGSNARVRWPSVMPNTAARRHLLMPAGIVHGP
jgi:hypothetical protein